MSRSPIDTRVLIAGGGIAAIETLLAIRDLTDGEAEITLLAPEREFTYRPLLVLEPFSSELADRRDLAALVADQRGTFVEDRLVSVDPVGCTARTASGTELEFGHAVIAIGARFRPSFESAHTLWVEHIPTSIEALLARATAAGGLDLIVPPGVTWTLPMYEFALMAARRAAERGQSVPIEIFTPEPSPLAIFGPAAGAEITDLLEARGIGFSAGTWVVEREGKLAARPEGAAGLGGYAVALPTIEGIPIEGLPSDEHGFTPVDDHSLVRGCERIYAAGDGTDFPVKQGGIATQQADAAAERIAAAIGAEVEIRQHRPVLRGRVLTGAESVHLSTPLAGGEGEGIVSSDYLWWPPHKVSGRYLAPWLADGEVRADPEPPVRAIEVEASVPHEWHSEVMGASKPGSSLD